MNEIELIVLNISGVKVTSYMLDRGTTTEVAMLISMSGRIIIMSVFFSMMLSSWWLFPYITSQYALASYKRTDPPYKDIKTSIPVLMVGNTTIARTTSRKINGFPDKDTVKKHWKGDCSYPSYIPQVMQNQTWFSRYLYHLERVKLSADYKSDRPDNCARWWASNPQKYDVSRKEVRKRKQRWMKTFRETGYARPKCSFGQQSVERTRCATIHERLWRTLDKLNIVYFPRSGSELGVVRNGKYLSSDGDVDIFVDMPQEKLMKAVKFLKPSAHISGDVNSATSEVHWAVSGCPEVHMVYNDWMTSAMLTSQVRRPTLNSTCECRMNSVKMSCHKEAVQRMYIQYGPSWKVPMHGKALDSPHIAHDYSIVRILEKMSSNDGVIREESVRDLDRKIDYSEEDMEMILAQLNVCRALIKYQQRTHDYKFV